jgi:hypothetical protein
MSLKTKIILFVAGVLGCTLILQRCNKPLPTTKGPAQITYQNDTIVVSQKGKPDIKVFQPDPKSTVITTDDKGNVTVKVRQFGVGFDPGIGVGISSRPRVALDVRFAYFKRFGANAGLGFSLDRDDYRKGHLLDIVDPYVGGSFVPFTRFPNTSLVTAITVSKHVFVFVRVRF